MDGDRTRPRPLGARLDVRHDHLRVDRFKAIGVSLGAKTLLHVATAQPSRVDAMVLVSATPYFPQQARALNERNWLRIIPDVNAETTPVEPNW